MLVWRFFVAYFLLRVNPINTWSKLQPVFSPLNSSDAWTNADWEEWRDIHSGKASTAAILGFSTEVYFTRSSYHAIRSEDTGSVIGKLYRVPSQSE